MKSQHPYSPELALPVDEEQFDNASKNIEVEISDNTSMIPKAKVLRYAPTFEGKGSADWDERDFVGKKSNEGVSVKTGNKHNQARV